MVESSIHVEEAEQERMFWCLASEVGFGDPGDLDWFWELKHKCEDCDLDFW